MLKEQYERTEIEVITFTAGDMITTSGGDGYEGRNPNHQGSGGNEEYEGWNPHSN